MTDKFVNRVKSPFDLFSERKKLINEQSDVFVIDDPVAILAKKLHPGTLHLKISEIKKETETMRTFTLVPDIGSGTTELPYFKAGQYLSVKETVNGYPITRAYSICTTGKDAKSGFLKISIKLKEDGFFTPYVFENWKIDTKVVTSDALGIFGYNEMRDKTSQIGICGGAGVTPMISMMENIIQENLNLNFTLFYGANSEGEIAFKSQLGELEKEGKGRIRVVYVLLSPNSEEFEKGYITAEIIKKYVTKPYECTYYLCGPSAMYNFLGGELKKMNVPRRLIRREVMGEDRSFLLKDKDYAKYCNKKFKLTILHGKAQFELPMLGGESILVALERAQISAPSQCRSGECGYCRTKMHSGYVAINPDSDGRRLADIDMNFIHPCATYPLSDVTIELPVIEQC